MNLLVKRLLDKNDIIQKHLKATPPGSDLLMAGGRVEQVAPAVAKEIAAAQK